MHRLGWSEVAAIMVVAIADKLTTVGTVQRIGKLFVSKSHVSI